MTTETLTLAEEAAQLHQLKQEATEADSLAKDLKAAHAKAEIGFFERMQSEGVESIKHEGTLFVPVETIYGQVQDRAEFVAWAEEEMPELLEVKERKSLVNELIRERLDTGEVLPAGLGYYVKQYVSQRSGG
jgi:hypothetical protein